MKEQTKLPTIIHYYKNDELDRYRTAMSYLKFYVAYYAIKYKRMILRKLQSPEPQTPIQLGL